MRFFAILILVFTQSSFAAFTSNWYTEDAFLDRENILSSLVRLRGEYKLVENLSPYLTAGSDLQTPSTAVSEVATSSYAYGGPGFKIDLFGAQLYTELRGRAYYREAPNQKKLDARAMLTIGKYGDIGLDASRSILLFSELYSETLFTSADENNLIQSAYIRMGFRKPVVKDFMLDLFVEPFVTLDRIGHYYNNRADGKFSVRLQYSKAAYVVGLTGSYLYNQYFNNANFERNPYQDIRSGFRVLFVAGGTF